MSYRALLIDLDGVIRQWDDVQKPVEVKHGLPDGTLPRIAFERGLLPRVITGQISDDEWRRTIAERLQREQALPPAVAAQIIADWSAPVGRVDHEVVALLGQCPPTLTRVLVTNATTRLDADLVALGIAAHFAHIVNSSAIGVAKPEAGIFEKALELAGAAPHEALFVDDHPTNVKAAAALGLMAHHFVGVAPLRAFLVEKGIIAMK